MMSIILPLCRAVPLCKLLKQLIRIKSFRANKPIFLHEFTSAALQARSLHTKWSAISDTKVCMGPNGREQ